jgi:hypothetical protein
MKPLFAGLVALAVAVPASAELPEGNWRLSQHSTPLSDSRLLVLKVETKDGKPTAAVSDSMKQVMARGQEPTPVEVKVTEFKVDGDNVTLSATVAGQPLEFEGALDAKDKKTVYGSIDNGRLVTRARLTMQDDGKLAPFNAADRPKAPEPYAAAQKLNSAALQLQFRAQQAKDPNDRAELTAEIKKARAEADEKAPPLLRETVDKHADTPFAIDAAMQLLRGVAKTNPKPPEVDKWVNLIAADAARYGPRFARESAILTAEVLNTQGGYSPIALKAATKGAEGLTDKVPLATQSRALKALKAAQTASGQVNEARETDVRLVKVEAGLDAEYAKKVPPFKPEKVAGRSNKDANRLVVMELFTGAQCPPCVAADVAFDALEKAYDANDVVLIQYHMHIPGPDPLTNPDTIARWDYYRGKFAENVRGTPTTLFNGKPFEDYDKEPTHRGGGAMANAENKFRQYRAIIDPLREAKAEVTVIGSAKRTGDKVHVEVAVDGAKEPGEKVRLRFLVVEEKVKYVGGNGLRFHHKVVRAAPGGAAGMPLTGKDAKQAIDVDLAGIKKDLTKYLDGYAADRPFPNPDRPMDLAHLSVIALVQDDATGEILNAAEFEVTGK